MENELIPTRATLLEKLRDLDNQAVWQEFFDTYSPLIHNLAVKSGLNETEAEEVIQDTVIGVAKRIPGFRYDPEKGAFKTWLYNLVQWRIADQFRNRLYDKDSENRTPIWNHRHNRLLDQLPAPEPPDESEEIWEAGWENTLTKRAIARTILRVAPKTYQLFDLCVFQGVPPAKVAKTMHVSVGQVYLARFRVARMLKAEFKALKAERGDPTQASPKLNRPTNHKRQTQT